MLFKFGVVLTFLVVGVLFVGVALLVGKYLRPHAPNVQKSETYECGEKPVGMAWFNFNPRFYVMALIFVVFDVEIALTFPVAMVFAGLVEEGSGWLAFIELGLFLLILFAALAYAWAKGDLEWVRTIRTSPGRAAGEEAK